MCILRDITSVKGDLLGCYCLEIRLTSDANRDLALRNRYKTAIILLERNR